MNDILLNPKYTGYMVCNRRARKRGGRHNPPERWVWSPEPTHEPIVSRQMFEAARAVGKARLGSRSAGGPNAAHPDTKRSYVLRSMVRCRLCGARMFGKTRHNNPYYCCQPERRLGRREAAELPDHPSTVYLREDGLVQGVLRFFGERVFGPARRDLFEKDLRSSAANADRDRQARIVSLRKSDRGDRSPAGPAGSESGA